MNSFTISQLQDYSGIKAHTIRIWEHRYKALKPFRSDGNTRYYGSDQLRRLLNIVSLMNLDHKVSQLCLMPDEDLNKLIDQHYLKAESMNPDSEYFISQLILSAIDFDEILFDKLFSNCILRFGLKSTYIQVIYPAMVRIGLMWQKDSLPLAEEHFITNLIRQKILTAIDAIPHPVNDKNSWLLFLPEGEFHETGLLMSYFLIRQSGRKVIYLGANVPVNSLYETVKKISPSRILTFLVSKKNKMEEMELVNKLSKQIKPKKVYVASEHLSFKESKERQHFLQLHSVEELEKLLTIK